MATEERVVLTAELRDEASAPLRQVNRIVDQTTRNIEQGQRRQAAATSSASRATVQATGLAGSAMDRMQRTFQRGTSTAGRAMTNLQNSVAGSNNRIIRSVSTAGSAVSGMFSSAKRGGQDFVSGFRSSQAAASSFTGTLGNIGGAVGTVTRGAASISSSLSSAFDGAGTAVSRLGSKIGSEISAGARTAVGAVGTITAAIGGMAIGGGINRMLKIEDGDAKMKGLGVSDTDRATLMTNAGDAVSGTAFGLDSAVGIAASAMAAGKAPGQEMTDYLTLIADAATIAGTDLGEMGQIMGKVTNTGKMTTEVLYQFGDRGVGVLNMLAKAYGVPVSAMQDMVTAGEISAADFERVLRDNIGGAAQASGETTRGAFANMRAAMSRTGEALLTGFFPVFKVVFGTVQSVFNGLNKLIKPTTEALGAAFTAKAIPALQAFGESAQKWLGTAAGGLSALWDILVNRDFTGKFREIFGADEDSKVVDTLFKMRDGLASLQPLLAPIIAGLLAVGTNLLKTLPIIGRFIPAFNPVLAILATLIATSPELRAALGTAFEELLPALIATTDAMSEMLPVLVPLVVEAVKFAAVLIEKISPALPVLIPLVLSAVAAFKAWKAVTSTLTGLKLGYAAASTAVALATDKETKATKLGAAAYHIKAAALTVASGAMKVAAGAQTLFNLAMNANPIVKIVTVIALLVAGLIWFFTQTETGQAIVQAAWQGIQGAISGVVDWWNGTLIPALQSVGQWFSDVWNGAKDAVGTAVDWIREKAGAIASWFSDTFGPAISAVGDGFAAVWGWISRQAESASIIIQAVLKILVDFWNSTLLPALQAVGQWFADIWNGIVNNVINPVVEGVRWAIAGLVEFWNTILLPALQWVGDLFATIWNGILFVVQWVVDQVLVFVGLLVEFWNGTLLPALQWVGDLFASIWDGILALVQRVIDGVQSVVQGLVNFWNGTLSPAISSVAGWFSDKLSPAIDGVKGFIDGLKSGFDGFISFISSKVQPVIDTLQQAFGWLGDKVSGVMGSLKDFASDPLGGLRGWAEGVLGGASGGGVFSGGGVVPAHFAGGGVLGGYAPGKDTIPAMLSKGESVLVPELTRAIGPRNIMALNHQFSGGRPAGSGPSRASRSDALSSLSGVLGGSSERVHAAGGAVLGSSGERVHASGGAVLGGGEAGATTLVRIEEGAVQINVGTSGEGVTQSDLEAIKEAVEEVFEEAKRRGY